MADASRDCLIMEDAGDKMEDAAGKAEDSVDK